MLHGTTDFNNKVVSVNIALHAYHISKESIVAWLIDVVQQIEALVLDIFCPNFLMLVFWCTHRAA
jgi:hypothetical protein